MNEEKQASERVVTSLYTFNYMLGQDRQIQINGNILLGMSKDEAFQQVSDTADLLERLRAKLEIPLLEFREEQLKKQLDDTIRKGETVSAKIKMVGDNRDKSKALKAEFQVHQDTIAGIRAALVEGREKIEQNRRYVETGERDAA